MSLPRSPISKVMDGEEEEEEEIRRAWMKRTWETGCRVCYAKSAASVNTLPVEPTYVRTVHTYAKDTRGLLFLFVPFFVFFSYLNDVSIWVVLFHAPALGHGAGDDGKEEEEGGSRRQITTHPDRQVVETCRFPQSLFFFLQNSFCVTSLLPPLLDYREE